MTDEAGQERTAYDTRQARFNSAVPLEYAYAAWGELPPPEPGKRDDAAPRCEAMLPLLTAFVARRLLAMGYVARAFRGNPYTEKGTFDLATLATFDGKATTLAGAMNEFVTLERHVELGGWKAARYAPPERRVLAGEMLIVRYRTSLNSDPFAPIYPDVCYTLPARAAEQAVDRHPGVLPRDVPEFLFASTLGGPP